MGNMSPPGQTGSRTEKWEKWRAVRSFRRNKAIVQKLAGERSKIRFGFDERFGWAQKLGSERSHEEKLEKKTCWYLADLS